MANDNGAITNIKITATADTRSAQTSIANLARKLELLKTAVGNGIKLPNEEKIEAFATAMGSLKGVRWASIANGINKVADALGRMASVNVSPSAIRAISKAASAAPSGGSQKAAQQAVANAQPISGGAKSVVGALTSGHNIGGYLGGTKGHELDTKLGGIQEWDFNLVSRKLLEANAAMISFTDNAKRLQAVVSFMKKLGEVAATTLKVLYKFSSVVGKVAVNFAKVTANIAIAPWRKLGSSVGSVVKRLTGFFSALKRIAVYRAIRFALKELTQAFREGIANLYQYSLAINGQFAKSMDMLATSALYAKNSLAAMASPIVNVLAPAVDMITDQFVDLLNVINELIASLTGADTWTKALKYPIAYAEAADDANGSAKKLRATLLGFDEINRLDDNRKGSRGSAADLLDYSKMFEEREVTTKAKDFVSAIKEAFAKGDFTDIGKSIGTKIKNGLNKIDWAGIESVVTRNASSVATLINGFVDVDGLGTTIGTSIASAFNVAVSKMSTFFGTVRWDKVGSFLADGINGILQKFDTAKLGQNLAGIVNSAVTLIHNFSTNVKWAEVGSFVSKGINNFLATIKGRDIGETIAGIIGNAVDLIHGFTSSVKWSEFGKFLSDGINGFFTSLEVQNLAETISGVIKSAAEFVTATLSETDFAAIGAKVGQLIKDLKWGEILSGLGTVLFTALQSAISLAAGLVLSNPAFATGLAVIVGYKIAAALGATTVTQTVATALGGTVSAGANAAGVGLLAGTSAMALAIIAGLGVLASAAVFWICDKITDGQSTWQIKKALGLVMDQAEAGPKTFEESGLKNGRAISTGTTKSSVPYSTPYSYKAGGGDVQTGTLFLAGEAGAEIISSASGKTTVSNRDQIADSVALGNEEGNEILRELLSVARTISAKEFTSVAQITTGQITSALNRANVRSGSTLVPVQGG